MIMQTRSNEELDILLSDAVKMAEKYHRLVEVRLPLDGCMTIVGDTHGDIDTVLKIERQFFHDPDDDQQGMLLFLGDYVDRNEHDIENINHLLELSLMNPTSVILLRGNHEEYFVNVQYGFHENLKMQGLEDFYAKYEAIFKQLPLACHVQELNVFCCHGMTPVPSIPIDTINGLTRIAKMEDFDPITEQLLWNDPLANDGDASMPSPRGAGYHVGKRDLVEFLITNDIKLVIRSHQAFPEGYRFFFDRKVLSIFSRPNYGPFLNDATIARLHGDGRIDILKASVADEKFSKIDTLKLIK
jgi:diadenosine tetraphosphatase ApaH/serine/threonine PP2A family protein phosphatase